MFRGAILPPAQVGKYGATRIDGRKHDLTIGPAAAARAGAGVSGRTTEMEPPGSAMRWAAVKDGACWRERALVTCGDSGIGRAVAVAFAQGRQRGDRVPVGAGTARWVIGVPVPPPAERRRPRPAVEAAVELGRGEGLCVPGEPVAGREPGSVQLGMPVLVAPALRADPDRQGSRQRRGGPEAPPPDATPGGGATGQAVLSQVACWPHGPRHGSGLASPGCGGGPACRGHPEPAAGSSAGQHHRQRMPGCDTRLPRAPVPA
jgi:hypothetical protein